MFVNNYLRTIDGNPLIYQIALVHAKDKINYLFPGSFSYKTIAYQHKNIPKYNTKRYHAINKYIYAFFLLFNSIIFSVCNSRRNKNT